MSDSSTQGENIVKGVTATLTHVQPKYGVTCVPPETLIVQPKYGVICTPIEEPVVQPKYGVICVPPEVPTVQPAYGVPVDLPEVQPAYGVPIDLPEVQPAYGVPVIGGDLNITFPQLEENIATLKKAISTLKSSWDGETKKNIDTLNNSWVGADCSEYTAKVSNMDKKVQNSIAALELLCSTYEQARDMVKESQATTISSIRGLED